MRSKFLFAADNLNSTLYQIDATTGAATTIGTVGYNVNGLTWDSTTSTLYGSAAADVGLLRINTTTGAGTLVAGSFNSSSAGCVDRNVLLAANSGGSLYGWCDPLNDDLMSINKTTGVATLVGDSGLSTGQHGLAFNSADVLYMHNFDGGVWVVNIATGAVTFVFNTGVVAHHGDFNPDNGLYYGLAASGGTTTGTINIVDIAGQTGLTGTLATGVTNLHTLAFVDGQRTTVPEPNALLLLAIGMTGMGWVVRRRR